MGLIIISFVQTSKQAYECTGRACGFTSETPPDLSGEPLKPQLVIRFRFSRNGLFVSIIRSIEG